MFARLKEILVTEEIRIFTADFAKPVLLRPIVLCNTANQEVSVSLFIRHRDDLKKIGTIYGAILYNLVLDPQESIEVSRLRLLTGDYLTARSSVANSVSITADIETEE